MEPTSPRDNPGVIAPPPLIFIGFLLLGVLLDRLLPPGPIPGLFWTGIGIIGVAAVALLVCLLQFRRARTAIEPWRPTTAIIETGLYRYSRNPIYVGFALVHVGAGLVLGSILTVVSVVPALIVLHYGVILREERYLARKFGDAYYAYQSRVPRWL